VDVSLASYWTAVFWEAVAKEGTGTGELILRAGRSAAPYLMRQRRWKEASTLLEHVIRRDRSPATVAGTVPLLQRIAETTEGTVEGLVNAGVFASAWRLAIGKCGPGPVTRAKPRWCRASPIPAVVSPRFRLLCQRREAIDTRRGLILREASKDLIAQQIEQIQDRRANGLSSP